MLLYSCGVVIPQIYYVRIDVKMMKQIGLKRTKYKVYVLDRMGNAVECHGLKSERELDNFIYGLDDSVLFKAYIGGKLYCWHEKVA